MNKQRNHGGGSWNQNRLSILDKQSIKFETIEPDLFNQVAQKTAKTIAENTRSNKPTQLRRFYDEIVMWENKVSMYPNRFNEYLPFIRMMNAKAAYALGRKLVDKNYCDLLNHCLGQVNKSEQMRTFKLFMEAFMGFYKVERPKD